MPRVLIAEDDRVIANAMATHLRGAGMDVEWADNGDAALRKLRFERPDIAVIDLMLPGEDGWRITEALRSEGATIPIIMISARGSEHDKVHGLRIGADDYLAKPFSPRELVARVKAVLRRFERPLPPSPMTIGDIEIDPSAMTLTVRGSTVPTTATEFRLLDYFARHKGRVFSRDHLLDSVWRDTAYVTPRSVDVYVRRIREKIEPDPENPRYLKTVRGAGYRFEVPK